MAKIFQKFVNIGYVILFFMFSFHMLFINDNWKEFTPQTGKIVLYAVFILLLQETLVFLLKKCKNKTAVIIRVILLIIFTVSQGFIFIKANMAFGWDAWRVYEVADKGIAASGYFDYLAYNPNNIAISLLGRLWVKIMSWRAFFSTAQKLVVLNLICFDISLALGYFITKKISGINSADRFAFLFCVIIGLSPWMAVFYTDILVMVFPVVALFLYMWSEDELHQGKQYILLGLSVAITVIGAYLKITAVIVWIAIFIYMVISLNKNSVKNFIGKLIMLLCVVRVMVSGIEVCLKPVKNDIANSYPDIKAKGIYNFLEIGLMGYKQGSWTEVAVNPNDYQTDEEYVEAAKTRIMERMQGYGDKLLNHYFGKLIWAGTDGTFIYGSEGAFYHSSSDKSDSIRGKLHNFMYTDRQVYQEFYAQWLQGGWLLICILGIFSCIPSENKNNLFFIIKLAIGGLFLFLVIFENRARYVILYTPLIIAVSRIALGNLIKKIRNAKKT